MSERPVPTPETAMTTEVVRHIAITLNEISEALPNGHPGHAGLLWLYDYMDALWGAVTLEAARGEARGEARAARNAVTWGHVTRGRQRGYSEAAQRAEVVLRRAAAALTAEAEALRK